VKKKCHKVAIYGTGSFASKLASQLVELGFQVAYFIDEYTVGNFFEKEVYKAKQITALKLRDVEKIFIAISHVDYSELAVKRLISHGVERSFIMPFCDETSLQSLDYLSSQYGDSLKQALISPNYLELGELELNFIKDKLEKVISRLDKNKKSIALACYGEAGGYRQHIIGLASLLKYDFNLFELSNDDGVSALPMCEKLCISAELSRTVPNIDLIVTTSSYISGQRKTPKVEFPHVIINFNALTDEHFAKISSHERYYYFSPSIHNFEMLKDFLLKKRPDVTVVLIPGGYPKLDENIEMLANCEDGPPDSIMFAPTLSLSGDFGSGLNSINIGLDIASAVLEANSELQFIFRPHPSDLATVKKGKNKSRSARQLMALLDLCSTHPRCLLDDSPSYLPSFKRAIAMVSDTSSSAITFPLTTGRPVLFVSSDKGTQSFNQASEAFLAIRNRLGFSVKDCDELQTKIKEIVSGSPELALLDVDSVRRKLIYNLGCSKQYFIKNIHYILENREHPDWYYYYP